MPRSLLSVRLILGFGICFLLACQGATTRLDPETREALRRHLRPGEEHHYAIAVPAGHYLQLLVDQHGTDLVVALLDGRRPLVEVDNTLGADGSWGPERVFWVAETPASYRLRVRGLKPATAGGYQIQVESLRLATARDRRRAAAERGLEEGDAGYGAGRHEAAIESYSRALAELTVLGDPGRQADALFRRGRSRRRSRLHEAALRDYAQALEFYRQTGNRRQQAHVFHDRGYVHHSRGEIDRALGEFGRALPLWREVEDRRGEALTLSELGVIYRLLGENQRALVAYDRALVRWRQLGDRLGESTALHNRGRVYSSLGKRDQALSDLDRALAIRRDLGDERRVALVLDTLGRVHFRWRELEEAAEHLRAALELRESGDARRKAMTLAGLGWVHLESGELEQAGECFRRAREVFRSEGERGWEAKTLLGLGWLHSLQGELGKAAELHARAFELYRLTQDRAGMAETLLGSAVVERRLDRLEESKRKVEQALEMVEDLRSRASADSGLRATYFATWQSHYELYVDLLMELHGRRPEDGYAALALAASERARARSLLEGLGEIGARLDAGADPRQLALERRLERQITARQVRLMRLDGEAAAPIEEEQRELLRRYEKLRGQIREADPLYAQLSRPRPLDVAQIRRRVLDDETLLLEYQLGDERSFVWALSRDSLASAVLPPRREIEDLVREAYRLTIAHRRQSRRRSELLMAELGEILLGGVAAQLVGKKRLAIVAGGALHYLPFAALTLPRALETEGGAAPLISRYEIIALPSASSLAALRRQLAGRAPSAGTLAVVADPVFEASDPRLAGSAAGDPEETAGNGSRPRRRETAAPERYPRLIHSGREAEAILALVPASQKTFRAVGFDARREVVIGGELAGYRIVHFATHGVIDTRHPELSRLVLSLFGRDGRRRPQGLLHALEIYDLELPAELVVLSGCQTALGREIRGEGLVGLARGFLYAGAARVLVSLWQVDDQATAELIERLYRNLLVRRLPAPAALRQAQLEIRRQKRWREPYYWAGFVLQGEWRPMHRHPE